MVVVMMKKIIFAIMFFCMLHCLIAAPDGDKMFERSSYIDLMEKVLSAYSNEHIDRYFNDVKTNGLKEHGFPRLTANIGILIAHGRRTDLTSRFIEMMNFCCQQIPGVKAANDFSVKEIIFCLQELEKAQAVSPEKINEWKALLRTINPYTCYNVYAKDENHTVHNWAAFTMVSEYMRQIMGLTDSYKDFIDLQAYSQLRLLDENGMYRDPNEPMVYDLVTRGLFAIMLHENYNGKYKKEWQQALDKSAIPTLKMQSVTGELPYGGRSNQFIHNESHIAIMMEYYAGEFARKGDMATAGKFKAGVNRALENISEWLNKKPISHVKNRFPISSKYGCEHYAYFDKYMITAASFLYVAYRFCDPAIPAVELNDKQGDTWLSSDHFHKLFMRAGDYFAEYDYRADVHYDASGLGRLHKKGAPGAICIAAPGTDQPVYTTDIKSAARFAITPEVYSNGKWLSGTSTNAVHKVVKHTAKGETASAEILCRWVNGPQIKTAYLLDKDGMHITAEGDSEVGLLLPAFKFDGKEKAEITNSGNTLSIKYQNWICRYQVTGGVIRAAGKTGCNRNGHYRLFRAEGKKRFSVDITIFPAE